MKYVQIDMMTNQPSHIVMMNGFALTAWLDVFAESQKAVPSPCTPKGWPACTSSNLSGAWLFAGYPGNFCRVAPPRLTGHPK